MACIQVDISLSFCTVKSDESGPFQWIDVCLEQNCPDQGSPPCCSGLVCKHHTVKWRYSLACDGLVVLERVSLHDRREADNNTCRGLRRTCTDQLRSMDGRSSEDGLAGLGHSAHVAAGGRPLRPKSVLVVQRRQRRRQGVRIDPRTRLFAETSCMHQTRASGHGDGQEAGVTTCGLDIELTRGAVTFARVKGLQTVLELGPSRPGRR